MKLVPAAPIVLVILLLAVSGLAQSPPPQLPESAFTVLGDAKAPPPPPTSPPPLPTSPSEISLAFVGSHWSPPPPPPVIAKPPPAPVLPPPRSLAPPGLEQKPSKISPGTVGGIVGGVIGAVVVLAAFTVPCWIAKRRRLRGVMRLVEHHALDKVELGSRKPSRKGSNDWLDMEKGDLKPKVMGSTRGLSWMTGDGDRTPMALSEVHKSPMTVVSAFSQEPAVQSLDSLADRMFCLPLRRSLTHDCDSDSYILPDGTAMVVTRGHGGSIKVTRDVGSSLSTHSTGDASDGSQGSDETLTATGSGSVLPQLPWSDWELGPGDVQICKRSDGSLWNLGSGAYGTVYKALLDGVQEVAVKVFHDAHDPTQLSDVLREVAILKGCRNRNIVQFIGACIQSDRIQLVTEYMEAGDLWHALIAFRHTGALSWYRRGQRIALEATRGLHFLHAKNVVHFDFKSANILLTRDGTAKISDVGFANILSNTHLTSNAAFTFAWAAPEVLMGTPCTFKVDVYSLGVVLWELVTGEQPRRGQMRMCRVPEECPQEIDTLIMSCLDTDPEARPTTKEIVEVLQNLSSTEAPSA